MQCPIPRFKQCCFGHLYIPATFCIVCWNILCYGGGIGKQKAQTQETLSIRVILLTLSKRGHIYTDSDSAHQYSLFFWLLIKFVRGIFDGDLGMFCRIQKRRKMPAKLPVDVRTDNIPCVQHVDIVYLEAKLSVLEQRRETCNNWLENLLEIGEIAVAHHKCFAWCRHA